MEDLHDVAVAEELVERLERQLLRQRVDEHRPLVALARPRELHEAELRIVGPLAQELGVDRDVGVAGRLGAEAREGLGVHDDIQTAAPDGNFAVKSGTCHSGTVTPTSVAHRRRQGKRVRAAVHRRAR